MKEGSFGFESESLFEDVDYEVVRLKSCAYYTMKWLEKVSIALIPAVYGNIWKTFNW